MGKMALLVIDVQHALVTAEPYCKDEVIANIKTLIKACRTKGIEVIYVQHDGDEDELEPFSVGWAIYEDIQPMPQEQIFRKSFNSAFRQTNLNDYLIKNDYKTLMIVGMQTEFCIDTTVKVAFEFGYEIIMPEKTNTTFDNGKISAEDLYDYYQYRIFNNRFAQVESLETSLKRLETH